MKRISEVVLIVLASLAVTAGGSSALKAGEFSVGATVMYGWWRPFAANYLQQLDRKWPIKTTFYGANSSVLYGPVLGYKISDSWGLSFTLLMALHDQFSFASNNATLDLSGFHLARTTASRINKYDADFRATYAAAKHADIFIAVNSETNKFLGDYKALIAAPPFIPGTLPLKGSLRSFQYDCGPGFGVNIKFEPVKNFFAQVKLSLYVMAGTLERNVQNEKRKTNVHLAFKSIDEVVFSYYIEQAGTTLSIGGRYHAMTFALITTSPREYFKNYSTLFDQLGGVTFSVECKL